MGAHGGRQGDRGRPRREVRRVDLQRPHPGSHVAVPGGRAAPVHVRQRLHPPAHDPLPRHPSGRDGRRPRPGRRRDRAGRAHRLRVRRPAGRPAPLPLPRPSARGAHRQGALRGVHRRSRRRARGRRRARDGDERVRYELRPRQRGVRREHDRLRVHARADRRQARRAGPGLPRQRPRVRPDQLVPPAREPVPLLPHGHRPGAVRVHRHRDALPGPAGDPRMALPPPRPVHVPRAPVGVHGARLAGLLRGPGLMEGRAATDRDLRSDGLPAWLLGLVPLLLIVAAVGVFAALDGPGLGERRGPPAEELAVEKTVLEPGTIELTVRNDGPDAVAIAQAQVNDAFVQFSGADEPIGRLETATVRLRQPWVEGEAYEVALLTSTGATIAHEIAAAVETPAADLSFFGLLALLGLYVGVIPVALGMLWLPWVRRIPPGWLRAVMALTIGLLAFLAVDATLEGFELAGEGSQAFGGGALVLVGAAVAYLALTGVSSWLTGRQRAAAAGGASGATLALLVAVGIGLHNLGEGVAIGAAYSAGALALGAFLVIGFALHNTTEGLAIVAPVARERPALGRLALLGLVAGAPAVLGAWIGAAAFNASLAAFLFGFGAGAIVQVIVQLAPTLRDEGGRLLHPAAVSGILVGMATMFATGLLVSV